jgi:hypothetical protein
LGLRCLRGGERREKESGEQEDRGQAPTHTVLR